MYLAGGVDRTLPKMGAYGRVVSFISIHSTLFSRLCVWENRASIMVPFKTAPGDWPKGGGELGKLLNKAMDDEIGGFQGLLMRLDEAGLQHCVAAWRSNPNAPALKPETIIQIFKPGELAYIAAALGLAQDGLSQLLTSYLPARVHDQHRGGSK